MAASSAETVAHRLNAYGQPIGLPVDLPLPRPLPPHDDLTGRSVTLSALTPDHAPALYRAMTDPAGWTYLGADEPRTDEAAARRWAKAKAASQDPLFYSLLVGGAPQGVLSLLRINPEAASIEVGYIHYAPALQGTLAATEAQFLLMRHVFDDLGYRRHEWKCDALNAPSRKAAERLGFTYEGTFRQALVYKGRNRDTAWFSITDSEWPALKARFTRWLSPGNFHPDGRQKKRLQDA
ncbi:GNAT family N-acetyltransferase [Ponticoccus litoralis]|uniref:GNAT family protein n=1 Tax=Ponticoccus litoralis TaxID=422297 RepID=A0AAW9SMZ7_9RHOB